MRILITFVSFAIVLLGSTNAQTTLNGISANGSTYNVTYRDNVTFDDFETAISSNGSTNLGGDSIAAPWWNNNSTAANNFATALYNADNSLNNLRFSYKSGNFLGTDIVYYASYQGSDIDAQSAPASYAISAVEVPAPLPILGILPVVGFLKRMRKRQRA